MLSFNTRISKGDHIKPHFSVVTPYIILLWDDKKWFSEIIEWLESSDGWKTNNWTENMQRSINVPKTELWVLIIDFLRRLWPECANSYVSCWMVSMRSVIPSVVISVHLIHNMFTTIPLVVVGLLTIPVSNTPISVSYRRSISSNPITFAGYIVNTDPQFTRMKIS